MGVVDTFEKEGLEIFGPRMAAAQLEGSKVYAKDFMRRYGIPTAEYRTFTSYIYAEEYVRLKGAPVVIKADGLTAGKGVFIARTADEAINALKIIMKEGTFGTAGDRVVIEQCLSGEEASFMAITDGETIYPLATSQDHKRVFDNDEGPNTGGMGAYSPAPIITAKLEKEIMQKIVKPTMMGLSREGMTYKGVLYAGLMISDGKPYVLEFNCRFGDPEAQPILTRLETDLFDIMKACVKKRLNEVSIGWKDNASICVVLASKGYPGNYEKGKAINGLDNAKRMEDVVVFHAGTALNNSGFITSGGRVLGITALGKDINAAIERAYSAVEKISWEGMHYRKDIGAKARDKSQKDRNSKC